MRAVHFGAGNIGRGFIGEVLFNNDIAVTFVDMNAAVITALQERRSYEIELADKDKKQIHISNVTGINNGDDARSVIEAIVETDLITTAIGPNVLPHIAQLVAEGILARKDQGITQPIDIIACENMIGGSQFFKEEILKHLNDDGKSYLDRYIGFPNAAVDRIVPMQSHEDPLFVSVEPFSEWVVDQTQMKHSELKLEGVLYVEDLEPYIERKLFSVNTGHATVAYTGYYHDYETIDQAMEDEKILNQLRAVLNETGQLLEAKWGFEHDTHQEYIEKIIGRFQNEHISDDITRVARTPIRKLGYDERFVRPMREAYEQNLSIDALVDTIGMIFHYDDANDPQAVELQSLLDEKSVEDVIQEVTGLSDDSLIQKIVTAIEKY
ncbi:mannitol-1-phosphate 5-dehydrogenase [Aerococcaceae bacterium DSM 111020]|nr:mannitol-1-phosphate 5-dehydrogenase [Aerococcaceae bacterium DSM 111020]